ncbi:MAG: hypothetical protein HFE57_14105 [Firmicutes bacterium]|jgi:hypothetical protein|nr:hypothetical protein [Bacillota bacterium]
MEQKLTATIRQQIINSLTRSAWDKGVLVYALELFDNYIETSDIDSINQITEKDLLQGAKDWQQYSRGGFSLIYDEDICKRLSTPSEQKRTRYGELKPNSNKDWLDIQARALYQAAQIVRSIANKNTQKQALRRMSFHSL